MNSSHKPTVWTGVLVGAGLTAALIAVFYLAQQLAGTVFVPFDMFDWVGRVAPGDLITFGIDQIVAVITTFQLGELSSAAKTAELTLAILGMFATGAVVAGILYAVLLNLKPEQYQPAGLITGLIVGIPVMLISASVDKNSTQSPFVNSVWIMLGFLVWGYLLSWSYARMVGVDLNKPEQGVSVQPIDRRQFLVRLGGATAAITVVGAGLGAALRRPEEPAQVALNSGSSSAPQPWSASNKLPNADDPLVPAPGTRPELTPVDQHYRIDINTIPPRITEEEWLLSISGLVEAPMNMTLAELKAKYDPVDEFVTLACISNPIGGDLTSTTRWTGIRLKDLVADMKVSPNATYLKITSVDNFDEFVALDLINNDERVILAYEWDGLPLTVDHGFPLRIYIPDHYGMKQPKWITTIEVVEGWQEGWWVRRGWDKDAIMRATSVVDTVAADAVVTTEGGDKLIPIGGIAHAGDRGILKVEVRVDEGEWVEAQLRSPISETTWVIWRYDWLFTAGSHIFTVRCYEGDGTPQIEQYADTRPSGATGYYQMRESV
ncbi:MAG: molybdopterin-dependent oxidoreductase [Chloroflexi bacterium]|nr:molybdopterin-dependent oxidoreductase [Chloroflexota bacterium]MCC6894238.1 molybdopterin-dependent oxidoreductase [Anaerolineae bacterium]